MTVRGSSGGVSRTAGDTYYLMKDRLGSIINIMDASENLKTTYSYDAFGQPTATYHSGQVDCMYRFTGRVYDTGMGNYFYRARYYNQSLGRFFSRDPIFSLQSLYAYCNNSPANFGDPFGMIAFTTTESAQMAASMPQFSGDSGGGIICGNLPWWWFIPPPVCTGEPGRRNLEAGLNALGFGVGSVGSGVMCASTAGAVAVGWGVATVGLAYGCGYWIGTMIWGDSVAPGTVMAAMEAMIEGFSWQNPGGQFMDDMRADFEARLGFELRLIGNIQLSADDLSTGNKGFGLIGSGPGNGNGCSCIPDWSDYPDHGGAKSPVTEPILDFSSIAPIL